jgi:hypothetical protein
MIKVQDLPPDLPKKLPLTRIRIGSSWMRIHAKARNALWFGPASGRPPIHRFDDPRGRFRVCYLGTNKEVCVAETFLRNPPVRILSLDDLADRVIATLAVRRELRLVTPWTGPGPIRVDCAIDKRQRLREFTRLIAGVVGTHRQARRNSLSVPP